MKYLVVCFLLCVLLSLSLQYDESLQQAFLLGCISTSSLLLMSEVEC
jgi:hypothetical protein